MKVFVFIFLGLDLLNSYINTNLVVLFFWVGINTNSDSRANARNI